MTRGPANAGGGKGAGSSIVDLHTHTLRSDGVLTPVELVRAAADAGITTLAITDHDTLAGIRDLVLGRAMPAPIELITGVEINALARGIPLQDGELHILGFGMDLDDEAFEAKLASQRAARRVRFERTVARLREIGLPIDDQVARLDPDDDDALGRPTIARALIAAGLRDERRGRVPAADRLGRAGVRAARGAGPARGDRGDPRRRRAAGAGPLLGGAVADAAAPRADRTSAWAASRSTTGRSSPRPSTMVGAVASTLGLLATGGSDYHGDLMPYAEAHAVAERPRIGRRRAPGEARADDRCVSCPCST